TPRGARGRTLFDALGRPNEERSPPVLTPEALGFEIETAIDRRMFNYAIDDEAFESLDELLRLLRDDGVEPLFMAAPLPSTYMPTLTERYPAALSAWSAEMERRYPGIEVLHFSVDGYGAEDFRDADHLSERGAIRLADALAAAVRRRLPSRPADDHATGRSGA